MRAFRIAVLTLFATLSLFAEPQLARTEGAEDAPLATIAVISNPYLTTLPAKQIRDERGSLRDFLAATAAPSLTKSIELVNELQPDAFVILGSLTWSGSEADFDAVEKQLLQVKPPLFVTPGHLDRRQGSLQAFAGRFAKHDATNSAKLVNGVRLLFANDLHSDPDAATKRLSEQLGGAAAKANLIFAGLESEFARSKLKVDHPFWELVEEHKIAASFEPTRYSHRIRYQKSLPTWTVGSSAWSARGAISIVKVYADHLEMTEVRALDAASFALSIPNPVKRDRLKPSDQDKYQSPTYSENLALGPDFTFALVSDPQFDRQRNRETLIAKAKSGIEELNRLNPDLVFISGDLVNNNLPEEWELFNEMFSKLKPKRIVAPGNHDVLFNYDFVEASYSAAPQKNPEYAAIVKQALAEAAQEGFSGPTALFEKYTGSPPRQLFRHRNCAFITTPLLTLRADPAEIKHLSDHLAQTKQDKHVFVVSHYPSLSFFGNNVQPQAGGTEILGLLHEHRVTGFLFGHRHRNGYKFHERTAHVLSDNMGSIHLFHVFDDRLVIGRKQIGAPLYETLVVPASR